MGAALKKAALNRMKEPVGKIEPSHGLTHAGPQPARGRRCPRHRSMCSNRATPTGVVEPVER